MNNSNFIFAFSEEDKKELIINGFKYMGEVNMGIKRAYVFKDDCKKLNFTLDKSKYLVNNNMFY
ncbi:MAG: hypothetical protein ACRDDY_10295 [Clostridium sp.]|uniref:hypothetical protein n=1 Tax=Clostridium sp. TaxID=1506 RepID=UPI003EE47E1E